MSFVRDGDRGADADEIVEVVFLLFVMCYYLRFINVYNL